MSPYKRCIYQFKRIKLLITKPPAEALDVGLGLLFKINQWLFNLISNFSYHFLNKIKNFGSSITFEICLNFSFDYPNNYSK
jgi:hypothetical protein